MRTHEAAVPLEQAVVGHVEREAYALTALPGRPDPLYDLIANLGHVNVGDLRAGGRLSGCSCIYAWPRRTVRSLQQMQSPRCTSLTIHFVRTCLPLEKHKRGSNIALQQIGVREQHAWLCFVRTPTAPHHLHGVHAAVRSWHDQGKSRPALAPWLIGGSNRLSRCASSVSTAVKTEERGRLRVRGTLLAKYGMKPAPRCSLAQNSLTTKRPATGQPLVRVALASRDPLYASAPTGEADRGLPRKGSPANEARPREFPKQGFVSAPVQRSARGRAKLDAEQTEPKRREWRCATVRVRRRERKRRAITSAI